MREVVDVRRAAGDEGERGMALGSRRDVFGGEEAMPLAGAVVGAARGSLRGSREGESEMDWRLRIVFREVDVSILDESESTVEARLEWSSCILLRVVRISPRMAFSPLVVVDMVAFDLWER